MADELKQSGGRRIVPQAEADALVAKAGTASITRTRVGKPSGTKKPLNRREFLSYAMAGSLAVLTAMGLATVTSPNDEDALVAELPGKGEWIPGGFAYPIIKQGEFGGKFILTRSADSYTLEEPPELNPTGKFYIVRVPKPSGKELEELEKEVLKTSSGIVADDLGESYLIAIYQVCTHLGCLIPFQGAQNRFICPCHGSTFERDSHYVLGPAPRNLDQFPIIIENGQITVDTGKKATGVTHA